MADRPRVIVIGAGGHARVVLDILARSDEYAVHGLLDAGTQAASLDGVPVLGGDDLLPSLHAQGVRHAIIGVGSTGRGRLRLTLYDKVRAAGFEFANAVHPSAIVASTVTLGSGVAVMAGAVLNAGVSVGNNAIINTGSIVEHDCAVGAHAQVSPGAVVCGGVTVGVNVHVGAGATLRQGVTIGDDAVIGAGAVVLDDVAAGATVFGVPAKAAGMAASS